MKIYTRIITLVLLLSPFFLAAPFALSQMFLGASVNVVIDPPTPAPRSSVLITIESFSTDLNQASFVWYVNGVIKKQGPAEKTLTLITGGLGTTQIVDVDIDTKDIGPVSKRITIAPAEVDIIEQADSFTPPFYKGKTLTPPEGQVTLIALPSLVTQGGRKLSSSEIIFKWKRDNKVLGDQSGLGKNTLTLTAPYAPGETTIVTLEASAPGYNLSANQRYYLSPGTPEIVFYENNPLLGVTLNRALSTPYLLSQSEVTFIAYPFTFDADVLSNTDTSLLWNINYKNVETPKIGRNILTLRRPEGVSGSSNVSLDIQNSKKAFSFGSKNILVNFGDSGRKNNSF